MESTFLQLEHTEGPTSNIAPQHIFDGASLTDSSLTANASLPPSYRPASPESVALSHDRQRQLSPNSYDAIVQNNILLRTRVNELEVINGLYQENQRHFGRNPSVSKGDSATQDVDDLRQLLQESHQRESELRLRVLELEKRLGETEQPGLLEET